MTVEIAAPTETGTERPHNEDTVYAERLEDSALLAVADGMGGHRAGDVASQGAVDIFSKTVQTAEMDDDKKRLTEAVAAANDYLQELVAEEPELEGMGTTLVAALVRGETATIVNVGDSRAYHATDNGIEQVTTDQSLVGRRSRRRNSRMSNFFSHRQRMV